MAIPELTRKRVELLLAGFYEKRVPRHVRDKIRLTLGFRGNTVTLFEDRPFYNDPSQWTHSPVAQFRIDAKSLKWSLFCCDRNSRWHLYQGISVTSAIEDLLAEVDRDPSGIFWG